MAQEAPDKQSSLRNEKNTMTSGSNYRKEGELMAGLLPENLLLARTERGLTLRQAAERTGVAKETISDLERGLRKPHPPTLYKIAQGYGISVRELLGPISEVRETAHPLAEAPQEGGLPLDEKGRPLRYLRVLELLATRRNRMWTVKVERGSFTEREFADAVQELLDLDSAVAEGIGSDLLGALRTGDLVLPEAEQEALDRARASTDAWNATLWRANDVLKARKALNVEDIGDARERLAARQRVSA
jgi:transcriptional regulator with XRE-family HTH domain